MVSSGGFGAETWAQKPRGAPAKRRQASACLARGCEALLRVRHGELRRQRRRSDGVRRSGLCGGLLALGSSATGRGSRAGAHRARNWTERCRREAGDEVAWRRSGQSSRTSRSRASPGLLVRRGGPCGHCKGVSGFRSAQGPTTARESRRRADLPGAESGANPATAGDVADVGGRGVAPGARAELLRGFSGAVAWPGCWTAAAQSYGTAEQGDRTKLGLGAAARVGR